MEIKRVAVIGAGVMGAGIAAHVANAGVPVYLLDIVPDGAEDRNVLAKQAIARMLKTEPAPFMTRRAAALVKPGNIEDDLSVLGECDWIVEAVIERLDIKQDLFRKIDTARKPESIVSSNTSTLPLAKLTEGMPDSFCQDFLITHFFNPPRYMRLLEIVSGPMTRASTTDKIARFADVRLGKGVVHCNDTPSFVANRIGTFWIQCAIKEAFERGLTVEEADALMSRPISVPKLGVFGLMDLVGIDLMPHIDKSMADHLAPDDAYHALRGEFPFIQKMIDEGLTGRKGDGGFYRLRTNGKRIKQAIDLKTGEYHDAVRPVLASLDASKAGGLRVLVEHDDKGGEYAWAVLSQTLSYAVSLVPEIADDPVIVDRAMRLGYNWKYGPFELVDRLGADYLVERLSREGRPVPWLLGISAQNGSFYRVHEGKRQYLNTEGRYKDLVLPPGVLLLADVKAAGPPIMKNGSASLWDIGDGVVCLEYHTKMNAIDPDTLALMEKAVRAVAKDFKAMVIYNEGEHFSAGVNLGLALFAANTALWPMIEDMAAQGQKVLRGLKQAPFPVVAAPSGLTLGGGCETILNSDAVQAHAESYIGLVEVGVGVVPGWGGCTEMLTRLAQDPKRPKGPMPAVATAFETIGMAKVGRSAIEARELGYLAASDSITYNRARLLADAKAKALELAEDYTAPEPVLLALPGPTGKAALTLALNDLRAKGAATDHDMVVADVLADVLTGGPDADFIDPTEPDKVLKLEREGFMKLVRTEPTLARIEHTLETGKPLRN